MSFVGIQIHKHYSNGKLYSFALYQEAESCCNEDGICSINHKSGIDKNNEDCSCEDETEIYIISNNFLSEKHFELLIKKIDLPSQNYSHKTDYAINCFISFTNTLCFDTPLIFEHNRLQAKLGVFLC